LWTLKATVSLTIGMRFHAEEGLVKHLNCRQNTHNFGLICQTASRLVLLGLSLVAIFGLYTTNASAQATDVYVTPDGNATGNCSSNTHPPSWFNNSVNWGSGTGQIGADTVVHLCGTFDAPLGGTSLAVQGNGTSGHPVRILFENGTVLQSPAFSRGIDISNHHDITVDGGTNGIVRNNANGSKLANHRSVSAGVFANDCSPGCRVTNLSIVDLYVRSHNDPVNGVDQSNTNAVSFLRSNGLHVDHNVFINCGWCINGFGNGVEIDHNDVSKMDHGVASGPSTGAGSNMLIHDNHFHDMSQWDTLSNDYHHDGVHIFDDGGGFSNAQIYNNLFDGSLGVNTTAWITIEGGNGGGETGLKIFNNVLMNGDPSNQGKTMIWLQGNSSTTDAAVYNNYANEGYGSGVGLFVRFMVNVTVKNNIIGVIAFVNSSMAAGGVNNNVYYDLYRDFGNQNQFGWNGTNVSSITSWRSLCSCDAAGLLAPASQINASSGDVSAPSTAIGAGSNLTSLGIAMLNVDRNGIVRPASGAWDVGPYNSGSSLASPLSPTGLKAVVN
jgi:hypothetical protein